MGILLVEVLVVEVVEAMELEVVLVFVEVLIIEVVAGSAAGGTGAGGAGATSLGVACVPAGARGTGVAGAAGPGGARPRGIGAAGAGGVGGGGTGGDGAGDPGAGGAGGGGTGAGGTGAIDPGAGGAGAGGAVSGGAVAGGTVQWRPFFVPPSPSSLPPLDLVLRRVLDSPLPAPSPYAEQIDSFTEHREPGSCPASPVCTGRRVPHPRPPPVPGTHIMTLRPSFVPLRVPLPPPPESSLPAVPDPGSDLARAASPTISRVLATVVTDPCFESTATSALVAELVDFAAACRLDYATELVACSLVAESGSDCPPSVGGECALGTDVTEDKQEDFECLFLQITRDRARCTITLTQSHMVYQVLQRFDFRYSSPQSTPLPTSIEPSGPYPELVSCLMYLMTCTRPDLAYPLSIVARYVAPGRHRPKHWEAAKRVLRYLCSTLGMGLVLEGRGPVVLIGQADASWVDDLATQRSSQGYTFRLGSGSVSWRSTRSFSVLSSSCEAEIYAGAMAAQELRWLTYLLTDLGERPRSSPIMYVDNKVMIALCQEHRLEHKTKHIALHYFLDRELQQRGQFCLAYVATRANTDDVFTEALQSGDHQRFSTLLGLVPTLPHLLTA
ncbi:unnamed protein product [Closterium sp. NIES-53]